MPITVNVAGQVGQIRLPTSKALWPLFETVINSIQSLEESDTKKKVIVIDALRPEHTQLKTGEQGRTIIEEQAHFEAFTVTDNGNGFNSQNHQSFLEAYSQLKVKKGCKGIGRFLWLKAFDKVTVDSIYYEGNHWYSRTFDFALTGINQSRTLRNPSMMSLVKVKPSATPPAGQGSGSMKEQAARQQGAALQKGAATEDRQEKTTAQAAASAKYREDGVPQQELERFARFLLPKIQAFYQSEEGQRLFEEWINRRNAEEKTGKCKGS